MHPLLSDFLSLVGLISTYKQLSDARKSGEKADSAAAFQAWLTHAGLDEIAAKIEASADLQVALEQLLSERHSEISAKLETIEDAVRSVAGKLEGFAALSDSSPREEYLSDQACEFLVRLNSSLGQALVHTQGPILMIAFLGGSGGSYAPPEPRFFPDDLDKLEGAGWIKVAQINGSGQPIYAITRRGSQAAESIAAAEK